MMSKQIKKNKAMRGNNLKRHFNVTECPPPVTSDLIRGQSHVC